MNDLCKQRIRDRLIEALKKEGLPTNTAVGLLKVKKATLSCVKNPALWYNVGEANWEILQKWCNSGKSITDYAENGYSVVPSKSVASEEIVKELIAVDSAENTQEFLSELKKADADITARMQNIVSGQGKPDPIPVKSVPVPIKSVPKPKSTVKKESQPTYVSDARLVFLLMEERSRLVAGINAIDALLKMYAK